MSLKKISSIKENSINSVSVCNKEEAGQWYTLWEIKKHTISRMLMDMQGAEPFADCYMEGERVCLVLPYVEPRPLLRFYKGSLHNWEERRQVYMNLVSACMNTNMPLPLLYLLLKEKCLNIRQDNTIYFHYYLYLDELDPGRSERDCARLCAGILLELMEQEGMKEEKACIALMQKKIKRNAYYSFLEVCGCLKLIDGRKRWSLLWGRIPYPEQSTKDKFFRILLAVTVVMVILAVFLFLSQVIFGDIPFLRVFGQSVQEIGTESLLQ